MDIWMKVSADEYEFPLQIADTQRELAKLCGVRRDTIASAVYRARKNGFKSQYVKVEIDDECWWKG